MCILVNAVHYCERVQRRGNMRLKSTRIAKLLLRVFRITYDITVYAGKVVKITIFSIISGVCNGSRRHGSTWAR